MTQQAMPSRIPSAVDVLTPRQAAERLPMRRADALTWLRISGLVLEIEGRRFVIWGDVLDFTRDEGSAA